MVHLCGQCQNTAKYKVTSGTPGVVTFVTYLCSAHFEKSRAAIDPKAKVENNMYGFSIHPEHRKLF